MIVIREAKAEDASTIIDLWHAADLTRPWNDPQADYRRAFDWPGSAILIAENRGEVVGTAMVGFDGHRGWVYYLAVTESQRGRGIARALLDHCQARLRGHGCAKVALMVRDSNPAVDFYEHLGWEVQEVMVFGRWLGDEA